MAVGGSAAAGGQTGGPAAQSRSSSPSPWLLRVDARSPGPATGGRLTPISDSHIEL